MQEMTMYGFLVYAMVDWFSILKALWEPSGPAWEQNFLIILAHFFNWNFHFSASKNTRTLGPHFEQRVYVFLSSIVFAYTYASASTK